MIPMRRLRAIFVVLVMGMTPWLWTCTDADLEVGPERYVPIDDKLEIRGELCTSPPDELQFPLRILFIVDVSSSMEVVDPPDPVTGETNRERAVRETWERLLAESPQGVEFGIIRFAAEAQSTVAIMDPETGLPGSYFTNDPQRLAEGTVALRETSRTTNYLMALDEGIFELRESFLNQTQESLPLSKYMVIFLSDGVPNVDAGEGRANTRERILESVEAMVSMAQTFRVGDFSVHTAFLSTGVSVVDEAAADLLQAMADVGGGNYRGFAQGGQLNFLFAEFTELRRIFKLETLGAVNMNVVVDSEQIVRPEDLPAVTLGGEPRERDPAEDESDPEELENQAEIDTLAFIPQVSAPDELPYLFVDVLGTGEATCGTPLVDSDGDGLADMMEFYIGTDPLDRDTDGDGLSDYLEWRFRDAGLDPLDPSDSSCYIPPPCVDSNGDGLCDCIFDANRDGICDCVTDPDIPCLNEFGRDCVDSNGDGLCDCPDLNGDGRCDYNDTSGDGVHDCEEIYYGTSRRAVDTDGDGLPDFVEARFRTDPARVDVHEDFAMNGVPNQVEVLSNTDPRCDDNRVRARVAYQYDVRQVPRSGPQTCHEFTVRNITLVPTLPNRFAVWPGNNWNRIILYTSEVPVDDPEASGQFRFACVMANFDPVGEYKNPPSGLVRLTEDDFRLVGEFDPDEHCVWP